MFRFAILLTLVSPALRALSVNYEQITFNFFFDTLFTNQYPRVKQIEFSGYTENELSNFQLLPSCFPKKENDVVARLREKSFDSAVQRKRIDLRVGARQVAFQKIRKTSNK